MAPQTGTRLSFDELHVGVRVSEPSESDDAVEELGPVITLEPEDAPVRVSAPKQQFPRTKPPAISPDPTPGRPSVPVSTPKTDEPPQGGKSAALAEYREKLKLGRKTVEQTHAAIHDALESVRMGRIFLARNVTAATEKLVTGVLADPDLYFGLSQIKSLSRYAYTHSVNVATIAVAFAGVLGYPPRTTRDLAVGAILHDIGMMRLPHDLWFRNGAFTAAEFAEFRQHPALGIEIIESSRKKPPALSRSVIAQHHERWNGSGFPNGNKGAAISEAALICGLADTYDLLTTKSPCRRACLPQEALAAVFRQADRGFPRELVEQFTKLMGVYPVGSFVKLTTGEMGMVIRVHRSNLLLPVVLVLFDGTGNRLAVPVVRDLANEAPVDGRERFPIDRSLNPARYDIDPAHLFGAALAAAE